MNITYLLVLMQRIGKMHEQKLKELCRQYDLSLIEAKIIAFLHNNPTKKIPQVISSSYGCSQKGMYPRQLIFYVRRGFFQKQQTRRIAGKRIFPFSPSCENVTRAIDTFQSAFYHNLFDGFSLEEFQMFASLNERLASNVATIYHKGDY